MSEDLHRKYRPNTLKGIIGQDAIVRIFNNMFDNKRIPHGLLFVGKPGLGKTTLARIVARELNCISDVNLIEFNAADKSKVEDVRTLLPDLQYPAFGKNPIKFILIDECQRFSRSAWDSLLKIVEEPPDHVYFAFCTTELNKVPAAITEQRAMRFILKDVKIDDLIDLLVDVCEKEDIDLREDELFLIAKESYGSPRKALVNLSKCRGCGNKKEVAEVLETIEDEEQVIELCRLLITRNPDCLRVIKMLKGLKGTNPESIRINIVNWITACIFNARTETDINNYLRVLDLFSTPIYEATGFSELLLSVGDVCFRK